MPLSFGELLASVPPKKRNGTTKVLLALHQGQITRPAGVTTAEINRELALHLRRSVPKNPSQLLAAAARYVKSTSTKGGRRVWLLTDAGVRYLEALTRHSLQPPP